MYHRVVIGLLLFASACTPKLQGTCSSTADCHAGEVCDGNDLCVTLNPAQIVEPVAGALVSGHFHVAAAVAGNADDVTFTATAVDTGATLGSLVVKSGVNGMWEGNLVFDRTSFGGAANLRAAVHRAGSELLSTPVAVQIDQTAPSISIQFDGTHTFTRDATIEVAAMVTDDHAIASAQLVLPDGGAYDGTASGNLYTFTVPASDVVAPGAEAAVPFTLVATDVAGNREGLDNASALQVDDSAPVLSNAALDSGFDGVDGAGQGWLRGPSADPAAGDVVVSVQIDEAFIATAGAGAPVAIVGGTSFPGTAAGKRWTFSLPRSVGAGATAPVAVSFAASDQVGHTAASSPSLALQFDDVAPAAFAPALSADATWYARSPDVKAPVVVSIAAAPRSGVAGVVLRVAGQPDAQCTGSAESWLCVLPTTLAPAGAESVLAVTVAAMSVTGVASTVTTTRNVDDAPPVISATPAIPYPAATSAPDRWGHDGAHFTLRDSGALYRFSAWDCGAGIRSVSAFSTSPVLASSTAAVADSGARHPCDNGTTAIVYDVAVASDLGVAGAFPAADNLLSVAATVADSVEGGSRPTGVHSASASRTDIQVTRRLWQTPGGGFSNLAVGPAIVVSGPAGLSGLSPSDGRTLWASAVAPLSGPVIGGTAAAPVGYYGQGSNTSENTLVAFDPSTGAVSKSCVVASTPALPTGCRAAVPSVFRSSALALESDGSGLLLASTGARGIDSQGNGCGAQRAVFEQISAGVCSFNGATMISQADGLQVGHGAHAFVASDIYDFAFDAPGDVTLSEVSAAGGAVTASTVSATSCILTDDAGSDSPLCDGSRYVWTGSGFAGPSYNSGPADVSLPGSDLYFAGPSAFALSSGAAAFAGSGTVLAVDASPNPIAYVASGGSVQAVHVGASAFGTQPFTLPPLLDTVVSDLALDRRGTLYVVSGNGQVSAMATDSPGLATQGFGWATRGRDACRSSSLDFTCPF
ncbi:MAG TPA: hypothetical protein VGH20_19360 [Myxococcales bacterium]